MYNDNYDNKGHNCDIISIIVVEIVENVEYWMK